MRLALISSLAALVVAAVAATALAAPDARLGGDFKMTGTILTSRGFDAKPGDKITRRYKFRPQCPAGPCRATFYRQRADGKFIRSTIYRRKPGFYKALDKARAACTRNGRVVGHTTVTTKTAVTILRARDGRATKIRADLVASSPKTLHCASSHQTVRLTGVRL